MTFSWAQNKIDVKNHIIAQARIKAKGKSIDFAIKHNDEVIDAAKNNYVKLDQRIKLEVEKYQAKAIERRNKRI